VSESSDFNLRKNNSGVGQAFPPVVFG